MQSGQAAGLGTSLMHDAIFELLGLATKAPSIALKAMPAVFAEAVYGSISLAMEKRVPALVSALGEL